MSDDIDHVVDVPPRALSDGAPPFDLASLADDAHSTEPDDDKPPPAPSLIDVLRKVYPKPTAKRLIELLELDKSVGQSTFVNRVDAWFEYESKPYDDEFRVLHVEPLLEQASRLLDRSLADREKWDEYAVEATKLALEIEEVARLDEVRQREDAAGFADLPYRRSQLERSAEAKRLEGNYIAQYHINWLMDNYWTEPNAQKVVLHIRLAHWVGSLNLRDGDSHGTVVPYDFYGVVAQKQDHLHQVGIVRGYQDIATQFNNLLAQTALYDAAYGSAQDQVRSLTVLEAWNRALITFRRDRREVARIIARKKAAAVTTANGTLNYFEKLTFIADRYNADLREAYARLTKVAKGMEVLYGYSEPLPKPSTDRLLDKCVNWARNATNWLVRFTRITQNYVLPISLKRHMSDDEWEEGRKLGRWRFDVSEAEFPQQYHVRLRGISVFVAGRDLKGVWQATVRAPTQDTYVRHHPPSNAKVPLDSFQSPEDVPPCRLGRIADRQHLRDPDVTGVSSLHNVSPFGTWELHMGSASTGGTDTTWLTDVQVDLHLSVRSGAKI